MMLKETVLGRKDLYPPSRRTARMLPLALFYTKFSLKEKQRIQTGRERVARLNINE